MKNYHPIVKDLLSEIEDYRARSGIDRTRFGLDALNDGHFISRLEAGRMPDIKTIDRVRAFMNGNSKAARPYKGSGK